MASEDGNLFPLRRLDMLKCHLKELNPEVVDILSEKTPDLQDCVVRVTQLLDSNVNLVWGQLSTYTCN